VLLLTGQVTHPVAARLNWAYVPAKQAEQAVAPAVPEKLPATQAVQAPLEEAPGVAE